MGFKFKIIQLRLVSNVLNIGFMASILFYFVLAYVQGAGIIEFHINDYYEAIPEIILAFIAVSFTIFFWFYDLKHLGVVKDE